MHGLPVHFTQLVRLRVGWLNGFSFITSGRGAARAEDAQGTPTQSHISPSILVYEDNRPCSWSLKLDVDSEIWSIETIWQLSAENII